MKFSCRGILLGAVLLAGSTSAVDAADESSRIQGLICPPPISTCGDATTGAVTRCPVGYQCTCVSSCPGCRDCAVRVCVASPDASCRTACDCTPGLGCFDGQCIAGFAPVYCCEREPCLPGVQCQHLDGRMDRCGRACFDQTWLCDPEAGPDRGCGPDRVCSCTASCPFCEDCGANVCVPPGAPTPYRCNRDGTCAQEGDQCICVSSCPACDDCALSVCVPSCDPTCEKRLRKSAHLIRRVVEKTRRCRADAECVRVDTSSGCRGTCGAWVNERYAGRVRFFIDHVDERYCSGYREDGCPFVTPRCIDERGVCARGRCTGVQRTAEPDGAE